MHTTKEQDLEQTEQPLPEQTSSEDNGSTVDQGDKVNVEVSKDVREYKLALIVSSFINEETITNYINKHLPSIIRNFSIVKQGEIMRYDVYHHRKMLKTNTIFCTIKMHCQDVQKLKDDIKKHEMFLKFLVVSSNNDIGDQITFEDPTALKKYLYESLRIMPSILSENASKSVQRKKSKNIIRARNLGLILRTTRYVKIENKSSEQEE